MSDTALQIGELKFTRIFDAPRELVFRCMTEPEHLTHFWGPVGVSTPLDNITVELRPGGIFKTVMVDDSSGAEYPSQGVFSEITPPERLVWREPDIGMVTTSDFVDLGDGRTEVRILQTNVPEMFRGAEAQAGFLSSLDKFAAYLATISAT